MIAVDLDDDRDSLEAFRDKYGTSYPVAVEEEDRMRKAFGIPGCPATVLIDRRGRMVGRATGGDGDWTSDAARALTKSLLGIGVETQLKPARARQARVPPAQCAAPAIRDADRGGLRRPLDRGSRLSVPILRPEDGARAGGRDATRRSSPAESAG